MNDLFVAMDFKTRLEMEDFLKPFESQPIALKIGMSMFYQNGPQLVEDLVERGYTLFLDLKCHDIPNTVYLALRQLADLPVALLTVHTQGGSEMLQAAMSGVREAAYSPKVLGITQLTSISPILLQEELQITTSLTDSVVHLAQLAQSSGLDGVVSSIQETRLIKEKTDKSFLTLSPGIRPKTAKRDDQKRVATPSEARKAGVDYIVVGRPIIQAENPVEAYYTILEEWSR